MRRAARSSPARESRSGGEEAELPPSTTDPAVPTRCPNDPKPGHGAMRAWAAPMRRQPAWLRSLVAVRRRASSCRNWLCKPEVTGSIPVRSIAHRPGNRRFLRSSFPDCLGARRQNMARIGGEVPAPGPRSRGQGGRGALDHLHARARVSARQTRESPKRSRSPARDGTRPAVRPASVWHQALVSS